ncbi:juvenile hormone esterase-like [Leguminivora glycinivorella]|uniref:juvenile hormone esterase-like n=1 Tax=Leguminivora glycinivorella TaxID=1035111 RepID=UPI00200C92A8|nr:juvenile hormone esterase-like [Leguminivora glycinivorella]
MRWLALCCALCSAVGRRFPLPPPPHRDVETSSGVARGYLLPRPPHYAFLGLPYARAPQPHTRFRAAESPVRWDGVFEAAYRVRCAQPGQRGDPACLVLNVFAPERAAAAAAAGPVLVHLHAGHFATGWGSHSAPPRLLQEFVVVTLNHRLGADGFLCLGTRAAPGNAGLKDLVAALEWIHDNIEKFGGDASQVTLYGTGAGAAAAELLLLSGAIDGYVQRAILEGGSALAPAALAADPAGAALQVAEALGYEDDGTKTNEHLTDFYQNIPVEKTLNYSNRFAPCVESVAEYSSALLIKDPREILQTGIFKSIPLLIAYSKERSLDDDEMFQTLPHKFEDLLPNNLLFDSEELKKRVGEQVQETYFGGQEAGADIIEHFESYMNDVFAAYPAVKSAALHAAASDAPVYLMEFKPRDQTNTIYQYVFGKESLNEVEEEIAVKLVTMWSNFLKFSDPTPLETSILPEIWRPVTVRIRNERPDISTAACLVLDLSQVTLEMGVPSSGHTLPIWDHIYEIFYKSHTPKLHLSESDVLLYNEELAFISIKSQHESTKKGSNSGGNKENRPDGEGIVEEENDRNGQDEEGSVAGDNDRNRVDEEGSVTEEQDPNRQEEEGNDTNGQEEEQSVVGDNDTPPPQEEGSEAEDNDTKRQDGAGSADNDSHENDDKPKNVNYDIYDNVPVTDDNAEDEESVGSVDDY